MHALKCPNFILLLFSVAILFGKVCDASCNLGSCLKFDQSSLPAIIGKEGTCCWYIQPNLGAGKQPRYITLTFGTFNFEGARTLQIYKGNQYKSSNLYASYAGLLGQAGAAPADPMEIHSGTLLLIVEGDDGAYSFSVAFESSTSTQTNPSLNLFYALLFLFSFSLGFSVFLRCPCIKFEDDVKKQRTTSLVFAAGAIFGGFFLILVLARAINL